MKKGAKFGLIGYPIAHSQSPELFRKAYGGRYAYDLIEEADFYRAWQRFLDGYDAVNVTAPFKEPALRRADLPAPECLKIGATNLLVKTPEGVKAWNSDYLGVLELLRVQAGKGDHAALQKYQMMFRPVFALGFAGMTLSAPFSLKPLRFLLGNRVTAFLSAISMNYYLTHQTIAVHLRRLGWPPSASAAPNMAGEQPWQTQYTLACFGISLAAAILITYLVEKPAGRLLDRWRKSGQ